MKKLIFIAIMVLLLVFAGCEKQTIENKPVEIKPVAAPVKQETEQQSPAVEAFSPSFEVQSIDKKTEQRINGISWREGSPVAMDDLRYVEVSYWGFDGKGHTGELIVNKAVAKEITDIFKELYDEKFAIERIKLVDEYAADDTKSMEDDNTSAFNYREVEGKPGKLSMHAYGLAIDINPVQNPYIYKDEISPEAGKAYEDRTDIREGMITQNDTCYKAFTSRGWTWGGDWKYEKDYQHFQKSIDVK